MEAVIKSFKNLYFGEGIIKKHLLLLLLLFIPSVLWALSSITDKDTPEKLLLVIALILLPLIVLSIIPLIWLLGYGICFVKDRLNDVVGIPQVNFNMLKQGFKVLPLTIVWTLYFGTVFIVLFALPFVPALIHLANGVKYSTVDLVFAAVGLMLVVLIMFALCILVLPFYNYIIIEYVKNGNRGYLYNPARLVKYMKAAFKDTLIVFGKFLVVGLVFAVPVGVLSFFVFMVNATLIMIVIASYNSSEDITPYAIITLLIVVFLGVVIKLIQMYVNTIVGNAASENYVNVYKEKIENVTEENEEATQI